MDKDDYKMHFTIACVVLFCFILVIFGLIAENKELKEEIQVKEKIINTLIMR